MTHLAPLALALFVPATFAAAQPPGLESGPGKDLTPFGQAQAQKADEPEDKRLLRLLAEIADTRRQTLAVLSQRPVPNQPGQPARGRDIPLDVYRVCDDGGRPYSEGARLTLPSVGTLVCHRIGPMAVDKFNRGAAPLGWEREQVRQK